MNYNKLKQLCEAEPQCYFPSEHIVKSTVANTPEWLRRYFRDDKVKG